MAARDRPPAPPGAFGHPKTSNCAVLEPPPRPPAALSAERDVCDASGMSPAFGPVTQIL